MAPVRACCCSSSCASVFLDRPCNVPCHGPVQVLCLCLPFGRGAPSSREAFVSHLTLGKEETLQGERAYGSMHLNGIRTFIHPCVCSTFQPECRFHHCCCCRCSSREDKSSSARAQTSPMSLRRLSFMSLASAMTASRAAVSNSRMTPSAAEMPKHRQATEPQPTDPSCC